MWPGTSPFAPTAMACRLLEDAMQRRSIRERCKAPGFRAEISSLDTSERFYVTTERMKTRTGDPIKLSKQRFYE